MDSAKPSQTLEIEVRNHVAKAVVNAIAESIKSDCGWEFVEGIEKAYIKYLNKRAKNIGNNLWELEINSGNPDINFCIYDENYEEILSYKTNLFKFLDNEYADCIRSQADLVFSIKQLAERLEKSFCKRHKIRLDVDEVEEKYKETYRNEYGREVPQ